MKRPAAPLSFVALVLLAVAAMILQTGSVPHLHGGTQAGIYNQEHDLTLLAGLAGQGLPSDATPALSLDTVSVPVSPFVPERPTLPLALSGDSRAPPAA